MIAGEQHRLALPPGYQLGKYRLRQVLGAGGFGITYLAADDSLGRMVAIKELIPNDIATRVDGTTVVAKTTSEESNLAWARTRFVEEGRALAACDHPNVIHVYEMIEANGTAYMVTKYEKGRSLSQKLEAMGRPPTESELRAILMPLLSGLERVHEAGFLHRDIKPENIYMTEDERPLLLDFGSARQAISDRTMAMTSIVTAGYAPFEQYHEDGHQGTWSDIYALSAVMYRAIHGKKPPESTRRLKDDPCLILAEVYAGQYSEKFLNAIDQGLLVEYEDRPQTVAEWREIISGEVMSRRLKPLVVPPKKGDSKRGTDSKRASESKRTGASKLTGVSKRRNPSQKVPPPPKPFLEQCLDQIRDKPLILVASIALLIGGAGIWKLLSPKPVPPIVAANSTPTPASATPTPTPTPTSAPATPSSSVPATPLPAVATNPAPRDLPPATIPQTNPQTLPQTILPLPNLNDSTPSPGGNSPNSGGGVVVKTVDAKLVGTWEAKGTGADGAAWSMRWEQQADGHFAITGALPDTGTLTAANGKMQQFSDTTQQTSDLTYKITASTLLTTGPSGPMTWKKLSSGSGTKSGNSSGTSRTRSSGSGSSEGSSHHDWQRFIPRNVPFHW